jgi:hypothetical protein
MGLGFVLGLRHALDADHVAAERLHLWLPVSLEVGGIDLVQRIATAHGLQCLACDDGEWLRAVSVSDPEPLIVALEALAARRVDWIVLEAGPRERFFLQVGPRQDDGFAQAELVSDRFLGALAHSRAVSAQLSLLRWREPDAQRSELHHQRIDVATPAARARAAQWLWRSWTAAFSHRLDADASTVRLRTLSS